MSPRLATLVDQLAGAYPRDPQNETLPRFLEELKPAEIAELFSHTFSLYREAVDAEHELSLKTKPYGVEARLSRETAQLGNIADALLVRLEAAGVKMCFAVRATAIDSHISQRSHSQTTIRRYANEFGGYYRFYTNTAWRSDKEMTAIHPGFLADYGKICLCNHSGSFASFDVRDTYLIEVRD